MSQFNSLGIQTLIIILLKQNIMKKHLLILPLLLANFSQALAFCGFYVAKADAKLFNKSSSVIIIRDGNPNDDYDEQRFSGRFERFCDGSSGS